MPSEPVFLCPPVTAAVFLLVSAGVPRAGDDIPTGVGPDSIWFQRLSYPHLLIGAAAPQSGDACISWHRLYVRIWHSTEGRRPAGIPSRLSRRCCFGGSGSLL